MKKSWILGLILMIAGAAVFTAGYFGSGRNLSSVNGNLGPIAVRVSGSGAGFGRSRDGAANGSADGEYRERSETYDAGDIRRIVLDEDNASVTVTASPDGQVHLRWQESSEDPMEIANSGGTLSVRRRTHIGIFFFWYFWNEDLHTELQVPRDVTVELSVTSDNGFVTATGVSISGGAEFSSGNGAVTAENLRLGPLTLDSDNGAIRAEGVTCASLEAKSSNGHIALTNVTAETALCAKTDNGDVTVENVSAGERVELRSYNGSVRGTLAGSNGDYTIESKTSNGSSNLPDGWGRGPVRLTVRTVNGSIDLKFAEE